MAALELIDMAVPVRATVGALAGKELGSLGRVVDGNRPWMTKLVVRDTSNGYTGDKVGQVFGVNRDVAYRTTSWEQAIDVGRMTASPFSEQQSVVNDFGVVFLCFDLVEELFIVLLFIRIWNDD